MVNKFRFTLIIETEEGLLPTTEEIEATLAGHTDGLSPEPTRIKVERYHPEGDDPS